MKRKLITKDILSQFCNVTNVLFSRPLCRRKPENTHRDQLNKKLVDDHSSKADNFAAIFEVAKILRKDIMNLRQWKFI